MRIALLSLLLISISWSTKINERGAAGPESNISHGEKTAVIYAPANSTRIEPTQFNSRVGLPNLDRLQPILLHNPIDDIGYQQVIPGHIAAPDASTIIVFDQDNAPHGLAALIADKGAQVVASLEEAGRMNKMPRGMFEVPSTITAGVQHFPGFNNDVEHLPITTLLRGDRPISEETLLLSVDEPHIPGRLVAPMYMSDMPRQSAIPIRTPAVPPQYRLQPGQAKQGLNYSTIAAAPKIIVKFSPIPNVVEVRNKREPFNIIQQTDCGKMGINDCLEKSDTVIPVGEKVITMDSKVRNTDVGYPSPVPAAFLRSTENNIVKIDADSEIVFAEAEPVEPLVGESSY